MDFCTWTWTMIMMIMMALQDWLASTCRAYGWNHGQSPLVWRELVQRGGKRQLIGGANEFCEYVSSYYDVRSSLTSHRLLQVNIIRGRLASGRALDTVITQ